jgi:hypothetical protein
MPNLFNPVVLTASGVLSATPTRLRTLDIRGASAGTVVVRETDSNGFIRATVTHPRLGFAAATSVTVEHVNLDFHHKPIYLELTGGVTRVAADLLDYGPHDKMSPIP